MPNNFEQLADIMHEELRLQKNLADTLENKLQAMRRHDTACLEDITAREQTVVNAVQEIAAQRNSVLRRITTALAMGRSASPTAKEIAKQSSEPTRSRIISLAAKLKEQARNVQRLNHVTAIASRKILTHFDAIFGIIASSGRDIGLYGRAGRTALLEQNRLVDAIA